MTHSYPHMTKINELAALLEKELKDYQANIEREISYAGVLEQSDEQAYWERRGYDREESASKAADELEAYHMVHGYETPFDDELKIIADALKALEALKLKTD